MRTQVTAAALGALACAILPTARADIVAYDSTRPVPDGYELINDAAAHYEPNSRIETPGGFENDAQAGDIVTLAGAGRTVSQFEARFFEFGSIGTLSLTATLSLYTSVNDVPDQLIWSGQASGVFTPINFGSILHLTYAPGVEVPDTFAFAIAVDTFSNIGVGGGPAFSTVGTLVGSSPDFVLLQDSTTLNWYHEVSPVRNLEAKIWTVPAPSAPIVLAIGAVVGARRRRPN